jgi:hypothetical protein
LINNSILFNEAFNRLTTTKDAKIEVYKCKHKQLISKISDNITKQNDPAEKMIDGNLYSIPNYLAHPLECNLQLVSTTNNLWDGMLSMACSGLF